MNNNNGLNYNHRQGGADFNPDGALNTSFGDKSKNAAQTPTTSKYYYHEHKRGSKDQLFLIDKRKKGETRVYQFTGMDIREVAKIVNSDPNYDGHGGTRYTLELGQSVTPCDWKAEANRSIWPQANFEDAHKAFIIKAKVSVPLNAFKKMLERRFPDDFEKFTRRERELNSVLYDQNGKLRETTSFRYSNQNLENGKFPRLFFIKDGHIIPFSNSSIEGIAAIKERERGEKIDGFFSSNYIIVIPKDIIPFTLCPNENEKLWPQYDLQSAYDDFINSFVDDNNQPFDIGVGFDEFCDFLQECYPSNYNRITMISEFADKIGGEVQVATINLRKPRYRELQSDVSVTTPDGQKWIIAHDAEAGTEIEGICKVVHTRHHSGFALEIVAAKGVDICKKVYECRSYPHHYFVNGSVYKEGETIVYRSDEKEQSPKSNNEEVKENTNEKLHTNKESHTNEELNTSEDNKVLSIDEALKALQEKFG